MRANVNEQFHSIGFVVVNSPFARLNTHALELSLKQYNPK